MRCTTQTSEAKHANGQVEIADRDAPQAGTGELDALLPAILDKAFKGEL
jgi:hypothetical protein